MQENKIKRRRLSAKERKQIYDKYSGHCAYCGCEISFSGMQADHIVPLNGWSVQGLDTMDNMNPSCRSCNKYKSTYDIETFRKMLSGIPQRLMRDVSTYGLAVRFGMVEERNEPIVFYFEKVEAEYEKI